MDEVVAWYDEAVRYNQERSRLDLSIVRWGNAGTDASKMIGRPAPLKLFTGQSHLQ